MIRKIINWIRLKIKQLFTTEYSESGVNTVSEYDLNHLPEKKPEIPAYFVDKENDIVYSKLNKIIRSINVSNITDLVNLFRLCYECRFLPNWEDEVIKRINNREINIDTTDSKLSSLLMYRIFSTFIAGNLKCRVESNPIKDLNNEDLKFVIDWLSTKMAYKWIGIVSCNTLTDAISLIFKTE